MANINMIPLQLDEETTIFVQAVEVNVPKTNTGEKAPGKPFNHAGNDDRIDAKILKFEEIAPRITKFTQKIKEQFIEDTDPDELSLHYSVGFDAKAGVSFFSANADASFDVEVKWKKKAD